MKKKEAKTKIQSKLVSLEVQVTVGEELFASATVETGNEEQEVAINIYDGKQQAFDVVYDSLEDAIKNLEKFRENLNALLDAMKKLKLDI